MIPLADVRAMLADWTERAEINCDDPSGVECDLARDVLTLAAALETAERERDSDRALIAALSHDHAAAVSDRDAMQRERDAARQAHAELAAAVRAEREACRRLPAHYDADYASSEERARVGALIDAHDAAEEHLTALLAAAPPRSTVDARVVREYLAADAAHWREINNVNGLHDPGRAGRCAATQGTRDAARAALDALLARCP